MAVAPTSVIRLSIIVRTDVMCWNRTEELELLERAVGLVQLLYELGRCNIAELLCCTLRQLAISRPWT